MKTAMRSFGVLVTFVVTLVIASACQVGDGQCWLPESQGQGQGGGPIVPGGPGGYGDVPTGGGGYGTDYVPCPDPQQMAIKCDYSLDYPHASMHVPGTVNVVAKVSCPVAIPAINVAMLIVGPVGATGSFSTTNAVELKPNLATANCIDGTYTATATFTLSAPPGFEPPTHTEYRVQTNTVKCNGGQ